jgi:hypothetical protein
MNFDENYTLIGLVMYTSQYYRRKPACKLVLGIATVWKPNKVRAPCVVGLVGFSAELATLTPLMVARGVPITIPAATTRWLSTSVGGFVFLVFLGLVLAEHNLANCRGAEGLAALH